MEGSGGGNVMCAACFHMAASVDDLEDHFDVCPKRALLDKEDNESSKKRKSPDAFDNDISPVIGKCMKDHLDGTGNANWQNELVIIL